MRGREKAANKEGKNGKERKKKNTTGSKKEK